jgi:poly(3-hydroxyalkanoate) synthetase
MARLSCSTPTLGCGQEYEPLPVEGSWWPEWTKWLTAQSGEPCDPPSMGVGRANGQLLPDAPGDYVRL